jgi:hypothetical protein
MGSVVNFEKGLDRTDSVEAPTTTSGLFCGAQDKDRTRQNAWHGIR